MAEENNLEWLETAKLIAITINFEDPTPTPKLTITPGDPDALVNAGKQQAQYIATKEDLIDMRAAIAQSFLALFYMMQNTVDSLRKYDDSNTHFTTGLTGRIADVESRQTTAEASIKDLLKQLTDAAGTEGAAEVIAARSSTAYGDFDTLDDRLEKIDALLAANVPAGATAIIPVGLNRQVPISVSYYEYAIGTEPDGLGTGPYGLGGSTPKEVPSSVQWPDANTAVVTLPAEYAEVTENGTVKLMADGSWTITYQEKTLRFVADA